MVFGSNDLRVAQRAAEIYHAGLAPWILVSGARGRMTETWDETEAVTMARVARAAGVPESVIFIENRATNTGENIRFSRELLAASGLTPRSAIVVQKPCRERRTRAALEAQWPELELCVTSSQFEFAAYRRGDLTPRLVIAAMVADFQRIPDYPALGFASGQPVPDAAREAFEIRVAAGFREHLR